jgi:hypothetical protein
LVFKLAQVLQIHQVFLEFLPGDLFEDGFLDEKTVLQPPLPAKILDLCGNLIVDLNRQSGLCLFHHSCIIKPLYNFVNNKFILVNFR